jgi:hypothetical protein
MRNLRANTAREPAGAKALESGAPDAGLEPGSSTVPAMVRVEAEAKSNIKVKGKRARAPALHELIYTCWASLRSANSRGRLFPHELWRCRRTAGSSPAFGALGMTKTLPIRLRSGGQAVVARPSRVSVDERTPYGD